MKRMLILVLCVIFTTSIFLNGCESTNDPSMNSENPNNVLDEGSTKDNNGDNEDSNIEGAEIKMDSEQTFTYSSNSTIGTLDPHRSGYTPEWAALSPLYENLTRYIATEDGGAQIEPGVAKSWKVSPDGLSWTFILREDAKWSDGQPVTAHDFVYTYQRIFDKNTASPYSWFPEPYIKGGSEYLMGNGSKEDIGVIADDEYTLRFELKQACPYFLQMVAFPTTKPVREDIIEKYGETYGSETEKVVGNGPFILESWAPGVGVTYVQNPYYWDKDNVYLQKLERKVIKEAAPAAQAALSGELDIVGANDPDWRAQIESTGQFDYKSDATAGLGWLMFNANNKYFKNKKIRQAFNIAFDRQAYIDDLQNGFGIPAYSLIPPGIHCGEKLYSDVTGEITVLQDLSKEYTDPKELLIEGLKEEGLNPDPSLVEVEFKTRGTGEWIKKMAEWYQQLWRETLGVNVIITMQPYQIMDQQFDDNDYDICQLGWSMDVDDPNNIISLFHTKTGYYPEKKTGWKGEEADKFNELIEKADASTDDVERAELYGEAERILMDAAFACPDNYGVRSTYVAKYVKGYNTNNFTYLDYKGVYISGKE